MPTQTSSPLTAESVMWTSRQPTNLNYLRANGFLFMIANMPKVSYFCQSANVPPLSLGVAEQPTPLLDIPHPGEKLTFGELEIRFMVSEDMSNFMELYTWLFGLGHPLNSDQFKDYVQSQAFRFPQIGKFSEGPQFSDATLLILDANNNPTAQFNFVDCFPTSMSNMSFDISSGEATFFQATATFRYLYYTANPVSLTTP
jgi:hypothetical protein